MLCQQRKTIPRDDIHVNTIPHQTTHGSPPKVSVSTPYPDCSLLVPDEVPVRRGDLTTVPIRYLRAEKSARKALKPGDILIETAGGSKGRPTGRTLLIQSRTLEGAEVPFTCASFARFLRVDEAQVNARYLYWFLQHLYQIGEMERHQVQHTGIARFQFTRFSEEIQVPLPPLPEQRHIAYILGMLDDKIELNRRMNQMLEEMARALFKSWFVDFDPVHAKATPKRHDTTHTQGGSDWTVERARAYLDRMDPNIAALFPDRFVDSELGPIPEGWDVSAIGKEVAVVGGSTPSTKDRSLWGGTINWATPKDLSTLSAPVLLETARQINESGLSKISSGLLPRGSVLLSSRAPIGYLAITEIPVAVNQGFIAMRCESRLSSVFVWLWTQANVDTILRNANGSTFQEISKQNFRPLGVVIPDSENLYAFDELVRPFYEQIVKNQRESRLLAGLRDGLLPKLMSGVLRVSGGFEF